jgi:hypothetical protein
MLRALLEIRRYQLRAIDKDLGTVEDFYFDDRLWKVRYVVVDTGHWLPGRQVLIGQEALERPDWEDQVLSVALTSNEVEDSPGIESDLPFSLQKERELRLFFKWREYWNDDIFIQPAEFRPMGAPGAKAVNPSVQEHAKGSTGLEGNPHLRSANEVRNYAIRSKNGDIGHVEDFMVTEDISDIRYLVVDTGNWLPGKKCLVSPRWIEAIDWGQQLVDVGMTREMIEGSPEYDPGIPISREYEARLYDYYRKPYDWE